MRFIKLLLAILLWLVVALCVTATVLPHFLDRIYYRGPASGHFDGQRFFNPDGVDSDLSPATRNRLLTRRILGDPDQPAWPEHVAVTPAKPPARLAGQDMRVTWVGHATVLIQAGGLNILTDPIWSATAGPFGIGPKRVAEPGIRFEDLPKIDLVVISHDHYDHMDLATLKRLWDRDRPVYVTSLGNDALLRGAGIPARHATTDCGACAGVEALDWSQDTIVSSAAQAGWPPAPGTSGQIARVTVVRTHHWGSRWFSDRNRALWSGFVIDTPAGSIFFAGDTGLGDGKWLAEARAAAAGPIRLALIPIGAFRFEERQMAVDSHIGPQGAVRVWRGLGQPFAVPIHWGTFRLSREAYDTPPRLLAVMLRCGGVDPAGFAAARIGVPVVVPPVGVSAPPLDLAAIDRCAGAGQFDRFR